MQKTIRMLVLVALVFFSSLAIKAEEDEFVVGMECNYAPYNWQSQTETAYSVALDGSGYCDGYDVRIAQDIADSLNKKLVIKRIAWDGLQAALDSGEIDAIIAGMTANEDRENGIDFTTPYYDTDMVMIVRKDDELADATSINDFSYKNVVGQISTNYDTVIDQIPNVNHMTPRESYPEMVIALKSREADGITAEVPVAESIVSANDDLTYVTFAEGQGFDIDNSVSIGLKEGSRGTEEFAAVQEALDNISQETRLEYMTWASENAPSETNEIDGSFIDKVITIAKEYYPIFLYGVYTTLILAIVGTLAGLLIGLLLGTLKAISIDPQDNLFKRVLKKILGLFVNFYVWVIRGTPMMVQAMFVYYGFLRPVLGWDVMSSGLLIISFNTGAYMAEIIRSGIQSIDKGQLEAARSLGMSYKSAMFHIILPQAIKNSFPSIGNEFIVNIKDSSMLNVIGVIELFFETKSVAGSVSLTTETYFIAALIYLFLTTLATWILNYTENKINPNNNLKKA